MERGNIVRERVLVIEINLSENKVIETGRALSARRSRKKLVFIQTVFSKPLLYCPKDVISPPSTKELLITRLTDVYIDDIYMKNVAVTDIQSTNTIMYHCLEK
jgi:hypothetical protein